MTGFKHVFAVVTALSLVGCASTPTNYYTLIPLIVEAPVSLEQAPFQFEVSNVQMPVQVDQPSIVLRQGNGALQFLESERWASPVGDEFHDALTGQLEQRFGTRDLARLSRPDAKPVLSLRADVRRFESVLDRYALIDVVWSLSLTGEGFNRRSITCSSVISIPAKIGVESLVLAHQRATSVLAESIAKTAVPWVRSVSHSSEKSATSDALCV